MWGPSVAAGRARGADVCSGSTALLGHSSLGDSRCFLVLLRRLAGGPWLLNAGNKSRDVKIKHKAAVLRPRCSPSLLSWLQLAVLGHFLLRLSYAGSLCPRFEKLG